MKPWSMPAAVVAVALVVARVGRADSPPRVAPAGPGAAESSPEALGLRERFGSPWAERLMESTDPEERLRGIERAAALHSDGALALLERATTDLTSSSKKAVATPARGAIPLEGVARTDPRALLAAVRGLAAFADRDSARAALTAIVDAAPASLRPRSAAPTGHPASGRDERDEDQDALRVILARQQAALAIANVGSTKSFEALMAIARSTGPGRPQRPRRARAPSALGGPAGGARADDARHGPFGIDGWRFAIARQHRPRGPR